MEDPADLALLTDGRSQGVGRLLAHLIQVICYDGGVVLAVT
jgi:hypothetical protein